MLWLGAYLLAQYLELDGVLGVERGGVEVGGVWYGMVLVAWTLGLCACR